MHQDRQSSSPSPEMNKLRSRKNFKAELDRMTEIGVVMKHEEPTTCVNSMAE